MRKPAIAAAVAALLMATAGCGTGRERGACDEADPAVVKQIMASARTDFRAPMSYVSPGLQIDHLELLASGSAALPKENREFGAERLVAVLVSTVLGGKDASAGDGSVDDVMFFAVDADGALLGPLGPHTAVLFDLTSPDESGWSSWGEETEDLSLAFELFRCLQPE